MDEKIKSKSGIVGAGLLAFGVLAILALLTLGKGGDHPLALESDLDLCALLGDEVWASLNYPASDPIARSPGFSAESSMACALELDPVPADDRFGRIARGEDANEIRRIALVNLTTTAGLRSASPEASSETYAALFHEELLADGWAARDLEGPWLWGSLYTNSENESATLIEDDGVVLWTTASEVEPEDMAAFTRSAAWQLRSVD